MSYAFVLDDINFWQAAFAEFGQDIGDLIDTNMLPYAEQVDLDYIDSVLHSEYQRDAMHQLENWIMKDKAGEVVNFIEHDNPDSKHQSAAWRVFRSRKDQPEQTALVNLIKPNADRITSQILGVGNEFSAQHKTPNEKEIVRNMNHIKNEIIESNNFDMTWNDCIDDAVNYGSGVLSIDYRAHHSNPDLLYFLGKLDNGDFLDEYEFMRFKQALYHHRIRRIDTFNVVRYRNANDKNSRSLNDPCHRWIHVNEPISVSKARADFPAFADQIVPDIDYHWKELNPAGFVNFDVDDMITRFDHYIRFPIRQTYGVGVERQLENGDGVFYQGYKQVERYAVAHIVRFPGVGIVDMNIDQYEHNRFPLEQIVVNSSRYHSCGIGFCKYGLDSQKIYNMFHNGVLKYMGRQIKGGGIIDTRLNITPSQLRRLSIPGEFVEANVPDHMQHRKLSELIHFNQPPTFPSSYGDVMALESRAIDESMSVPDSWKGIQQGTSGDQEEILQRQASMVHVKHERIVRNTIQNVAELLFSNVVQFERDPLEFYRQDNMTGEDVLVQMNVPINFIPVYNSIIGEYEAQPQMIMNPLAGLQYKVHVTPDSSIPSDPTQRQAFLNEIFNMIKEQARDPISIRILRAQNNATWNLDVISEILDQAEQILDAQSQSAMERQAEEIAFERQKELADLELKGDSNRIRERQIDQKPVTDAMKYTADKWESLIPKLARYVERYIREQNQSGEDYARESSNNMEQRRARGFQRSVA